MSFDSQQYSDDNDDDDLHDGDGRNEIYIPVLLHAGQTDEQKEKKDVRNSSDYVPRFKGSGRTGGRPSSSSSPSSSFLYLTFHFTPRVP